MKKYLTPKNVFLAAFTILLTILFFQFYLVYTPDSSQYYYLSLIIQGIVPFKSWILVRGPGFPLIISVITLIFGDNIFGLKTGLCIIYLSTCYLGYFILNKFLKQNKSKLEKIVIYALYIVLVVLNPIIFSYSHTLLTEMIMPLILLVSILIGDKISHTTYKKEKVKYILYSLYFVFIFILTWFIKQPYLPVIFSTLFIPNLLEWIKNRNLYNFLQKLITIVICFIGLFISIKCWDIFLSKYEFDTSINNTSSNSSMLSSTILRSINNNYRLQKKNCNYIDSELLNSIKNDNFLSDKDKTKILDLIKDGKCKNFDLFKVYDTKDNIIDTYVIYTNSGVITTKQALNFYISRTLERPMLTLDSYYRSYMSTLDLFERDINEYYVTKRLDINSYIKEGWLFQNEIRDYGLYVFESERDNTWWGKKETTNKYFIENYPAINHMEKLEEDSKIPSNLSYILTKLCIPYLFLFIASYFILPVVLIYSFIKYIKSKYNKKYFYITVLLGVSYFNLIAHVLMGTILDRYIYPGLPLVLIAYVLLILENKKYK